MNEQTENNINKQTNYFLKILIRKPNSRNTDWIVDPFRSHKQNRQTLTD